MPARDGAEPVGRQEGALVEQPPQDAEEVVDTDDAHERPAAPRHHLARRPLQLIVPVDQPGEVLAHRPRAGHRVLLDDRERHQRQHADHRAHLDRHDGAVRATQLVVVEAVLVVPETLLLHRLRDEREVLEELHDQVGGRPARPVEHRRDGGHRERVRRHPPGRVRLLEHVPLGEMRAVDRPDVVEAEEATLEDVRAVRVEAVHPPREVDEELVEDAAQEVDVGAALDDEHLERRPRLHRGIDVVEGPLVRGQRAVRMLEPLTAEKRQLVLREGRIDVRERHAVERHVPGREPRVLPRDRAST